MTAPRIVYNLTGRPLRARHFASIRADPVEPLWPLPLPPLYEPDATPHRIADEDPGQITDLGEAGRAIVDTAGDCCETARCIGCGVHLGDANARQYCAKTYCPFASPLDAGSIPCTTPATLPP
ncbi:hypothetical protein TW95_gp1505 [Pandoravirus inopinatum]|uniref:Uncharacterized protein n=1 Tax=Pandoravirus inopinatum TaxID=1605721 RepID=A0A0B5J3S4_9VIRU|nr:hypothetical protein TW95_gp1505 [Pandoravirus inopinatum]AJF98239.1 hypothetical protein [Pandoravirus inopinatum]